MPCKQEEAWEDAIEAAERADRALKWKALKKMWHEQAVQAGLCLQLIVEMRRLGLEVPLIACTEIEGAEEDVA